MRHTCLDNLRISHQHLPVHRHVGGIGQITEEVKAIKSSMQLKLYAIWRIVQKAMICKSMQHI